MAASLALIAGATVWTVIYAPVFADMATTRDDIARLGARQAHIAAMLAKTDTLQKALRAVRAADNTDGLFLTGADPAVLAADLQRRVAALVAGTGATLVSSRTAPVERQLDYRLVSLDIDISAAPASLQHVLYAIETARPLLTIDHLAIGVPDSDAIPLPGTPPSTLAHVRVTGYARGST